MSDSKKLDEVRTKIEDISKRRKNEGPISLNDVRIDLHTISEAILALIDRK